MSKFLVSVALGAMLFAPCFSVSAQQPARRVPTIGYLTTAAETTPNPYVEAFRQGLRDLGYVEGKNIHIEYRYAGGKSERLPELAQELVRLKVDVLVAGAAAVVRATKSATSTLPIVVTNMGDLSGLAASLARPGGNVTGLTHISAELVGKRLEVLKEVVPKISRVAFLKSDDATAAKAMFNDAQGTAKALAVQFRLLEVKVKNPDIEGTFRLIVRERIEGSHHRIVRTRKLSPKKSFGASRTESHSCDALGTGMGKRRWSYVLRCEPR